MEWQRYLQNQGRGAARGSPYGRSFAPQPRAPFGAKPSYPPPRPIVRGRSLPAVVRAVPSVPTYRRPAPTTSYPPPRRAVVQPFQARAPLAAMPALKPTNYQGRPAARLASSDVFLYEQKERTLPDVSNRYPRLFLSNDFAKLICHWPSNENLDIPLTTTLPFHTDPELTLSVPEVEAETPESEGKHTARVMLLSMAKHEEEVDGKKVPKPHFSKQIKFLVAKKTTGGLMSIGGQWSQAKDGGNPANDATLIKTAIRHCKETCGIDVSACKQWYKFIEVQYTRASGAKDRTVVFVPDVWNHLANGELKVYKQVQKQEAEVEEEVEVEVEVEEPAATEGEEPIKKMKKIKQKVTTKKTIENVVVRSMDLSLNGILEYDLQDKHEETAELSLFAEAFDEFVSRNYAKQILSILNVKKEESDKQSGELKRKREIENTERTAKLAAEREEREIKRKKMEEERELEKERRKKMDDEEKNMTEEQIKERRAKEAEERKKKEDEEKAKREEEDKKRKEEIEKRKKELDEEKKRKEEEEKLKKVRIVTVTTTNVDASILEPFSYFDKQVGTGQSGQLRRDKLEGLLFSLGDLCQREVEHLLRAVGLPKEKGQLGLYYKAIATTSTTVSKEEPIPEPTPEPVKEEEKPEMAVDEEKKEE